MGRSWTLVAVLCTATLVLTVKGLSASREVDRLARKVVDELQRRLYVINQGNAVERRDAESERIRVSEFGCPFSGPQKRSQRALKAESRSARAASIYEEATRIVKSRLSASGPGVADGVLARVNQWLKREKSDSCGVCPVQTPSSCDPRKPYREPDGSCNNLKNPTWGQAYACERRLLPAAYQDGISEPRAALSGRPLPNTRRVSYKMHTAKEAPDRRLTHLTMAFGQFLDHDLTATPPGTLPPLETFLGAGFQTGFSNGTVSWDIEFPPDDPDYPIFNRTSLPFSRSLPCCHCHVGPRKQMNSRTSFIDSSHIYGISGDIMDSLRAFDRGLLKYHSVNGSMFLPLSPVPENDTCSLFEEDKICLRAGDLRNNQNPGLIWLHTLFVREHNRIANKLATINAHWDDEKVFQVTKRIVDSRFQHVVYNEWLPGIVGADAMDKYDLWPLKEGYTKYDPRVDSTIINEFSTAAFRFGHSNVQGHFDLINEDGIKMGSIQLEDGYFQPFNYKGIEDNAFRGLIRQPMQTTDRFGDRALTNFLFRSPGRPYGADLFAIDIQRGRDHGIRPYADYVQLCRNVTLKTFADLSRLKLMPDDVEKLYSHVYEHKGEVLYGRRRDVRDIDFFSAGLNEPLVPGASLGPTFLCVVAEMFGRLKRGDRFYYEHGGQAGSFTPEQLRTIRETTLAKIICENTGVKKNLQRNVFQLLDSKECNLTCADFPEIQLELWDSNSGGDYSGNEAQLEA